MPFRAHVAIVVALACTPVCATGHGGRFTPNAMARVAGVSDAVVTPDGSRIAYVVSRTDLERNASNDELHVYTLASHTDRRLPFPHSSYVQVMWSPDGSTLAFVANDRASGTDQLFVSDLDSERRITHGRADVRNAAWGPDAKEFAFTRRDARPIRHGIAAFEDAFEVTDNAYLATQPARPAHVWVVSRAGVERRVTSGKWSVADAALSWAPDGSHVLYEHAPSATYGIEDRAYIERVDVVTGARDAPAHATPGEHDAVYASVGSAVAYLYPRSGDPSNESELSVVTPSGDVRDLTRGLNRHVESFAWAPDGRSVLLRIFDRTRVGLAIQPLRGSARALPLGDVTAASIESAGCVTRDGGVVFTGATPRRPSEVYYLAPHAKAPERLTHVNDAIAALDLGRMREIRWQNGGFTEYGVLTYPPHYDARRRYPLAIRIHGGPAETSLTAFDAFYQLAAARGYVVFAPNYRGSSNNGNAYERAIYDDASAGPGSDVMAGIAAVERLGIVDRSRIGVSGWSYGGQLTAWLIGHHHVWKAAVTGAAVNDLVVDYAIADDVDADRQAFRGPPDVDGNLALWRSQSPMSFVSHISTPTLILCNVYDVRVPVVESYELYRALRDRGVPVRFFAYPTAGHLPRGPVRLADAYRRWLDWFDAYLHPTVY